MSRLLALIASALLLAQTATAQTIDELREQLRNDLRQDQFAGGLVTLIMLSNELELSGINYELDDDANTEISALVLPFNYTFHPFENPKLGLYTEGVIGCSVMEQQGADIFNGDVPPLATSFDSEYTTYGALLGVGVERDLSDELAIAGIAQFGISYIENETDYGGPGSGLTPQIFDGILFNWNSWAATFGLAARMQWQRHLREGRRVDLTARYDVRWTESFDSSDEAQEFSTESTLTTFRMQYSAPTGVHLGAYPIRWRTHAGLSYLVPTETADPFGAIELGGGFDLMTLDDLPWVGGLTAGGAIFVGDGINGWSVGVGVVF